MAKEPEKNDLEIKISENLKALLNAYEIGYIKNLTVEQLTQTVTFEYKYFTYDTFRKNKRMIKNEMNKLNCPPDFFEALDKLSYQFAFEFRLLDKFFFYDLDEVLSEIDIAKDEVEKISENKLKTFAILFWYGIDYQDLTLLRTQDFDFEKNKIYVSRANPKKNDIALDERYMQIIKKCIEFHRKVYLKEFLPIVDSSSLRTGSNALYNYNLVAKARNFRALKATALNFNREIINIYNLYRMGIIVSDKQIRNYVKELYAGCSYDHIKILKTAYLSAFKVWLKKYKDFK